MTRLDLMLPPLTPNQILNKFRRAHKMGLVDGKCDRCDGEYFVLTEVGEVLCQRCWAEDQKREEEIG